MNKDCQISSERVAAALGLLKAVGVRRVGKRFQAYHGQSKKFKSIGYFDTFDQAVEARAAYLRENNIVPKIGRPKKV